MKWNVVCQCQNVTEKVPRRKCSSFTKHSSVFGLYLCILALRGRTSNCVNKYKRQSWPASAHTCLTSTADRRPVRPQGRHVGMVFACLGLPKTCRDHTISNFAPTVSSFNHNLGCGVGNMDMSQTFCIVLMAEAMD